jgi:outer membrane protein TolC
VVDAVPLAALSTASSAQALDDSPTLARAAAKLRQVEEDRRRAAGATQLPRVDAQLSANRVDVDPQALGAQACRSRPRSTSISRRSASPTSFDLFGATRNELAALQRRGRRPAPRARGGPPDARRQRRHRGDPRSVAARADRDAREIVSLQERQLADRRAPRALGTAAHGRRRRAAPRARAGARLVPELRAPARAGAPPARRLRRPGAARGAAARVPARPTLQLPAELPLSLPSELARQRPDIRVAEAMLQRAAARVGVATANLYPQLTLSATAGSLATHAGDLFGGGTAFYLLGASLAQPIFRGGELQAQRRSAIAAYEQAGAAYREVVLQGLQDVADVLRALEADARTLAERAERRDEARSRLAIAAARHQAGGISQYALLESERSCRSALLDRTQAVADRYADSAALLQALGGGWWNAGDVGRPLAASFL